MHILTCKLNGELSQQLQVLDHMLELFTDEVKAQEGVFF